MDYTKNKLNEAFQELNKSLEVIISLLLKGLQREGRMLNLKEQVELLSDLGVRPRKIANVLGRSPKYISKELVGIHKKNRKTESEG